jgi:endonuclease IV
MAPVGYTTGALEEAEVVDFIDELRALENNAIEYSALREHELESVLTAFREADLDDFAHVSFHAPSKLEKMTEAELVEALKEVAARGVEIVVHPDIIENHDLWKSFGSLLCVENMDQRKPCGRTAEELAEIFAKLPNASLCFDFAHVYQIDPTLCEAQKILEQFGDRIREIHLSSLNAECGHEALSYDTLLAFKSIASLIPRDVPVVLEAPMPADARLRQIETASKFLRKTFESAV